MGASDLDVSVHPRVRGALWQGHVGPCGHAGPSPRARGSRGVLALDHVRGRSIPACAGLSLSTVAVTSKGAVHPRVRGALSARRATLSCRSGPSPRARGSPFPSPHRPRCRSARPSRCPRTGTTGCPRPSGAWRGWDEQGSYVRSPSPTHLLSRGQAQKSQPENLAPADPVEDRLGEGLYVLDYIA